MIKYDRTFNFNTIDQQVIDYVNEIKKNNPGTTILINIPNTKGISSEMLKGLNSKVAIRIAGGYDNDRVEKNKNNRYVGGETGEYYWDSVIYTRNETIKIIEELEKVEKTVDANYSETEKAVYFYEKLKASIIYDPKNEQKSSNDIRSLRGLITKQTVCAGYSMIYKELCDRNNVPCYYAEGPGHAWNIIHTDGEYHGIDLTWDAGAYNRGNTKARNYLGNVDGFIKSHQPLPYEPVQDYANTLKPIDSSLIKNVVKNMGNERDFSTTVFRGVRKDGTKYLVTQVGTNKINGVDYFRYLYADISENGKESSPVVLYSEANIAKLVHAINFKEKVPNGYEEAIDNVLFSTQNIHNSIQEGTSYIGSTRKAPPEKGFVEKVSDINKPVEKKDLFRYPTKQFTRSDGTKIVVQQMLDKPKEASGIKVMRYDCFEIMKDENGKTFVRENTIWSERNLFKDNRQEMIDTLLSRDNLGNCASNTNGYLGYYGADNKKHYNPDLLDSFQRKSNGEAIFTTPTEEKSKENKEEVSFPSFEELHKLANKYALNFESADDLKVTDVQTGQRITDPKIVEEAAFANVWLYSAGIKWSSNDKRPGEFYAFNDSAEEIYNYVTKKASYDLKTTGNIDTIDLLKNAELFSYKHAQEIVVNFFRSVEQTRLLDNYFRKKLSSKLPASHQPETLYTLSYAGELLARQNASESNMRSM